MKVLYMRDSIHQQKRFLLFTTLSACYYKEWYYRFAAWVVVRVVKQKYKYSVIGSRNASVVVVVAGSGGRRQVTLTVDRCMKM